MSSSPPSLGAVIVAAGASSRMAGPATETRTETRAAGRAGRQDSGQAVDKLFAPLGGRPLLARTIAAFQGCDQVARIALVLSQANLDRGSRLVRDHGFDKVASVSVGGPRRQDSVLLGLEVLGPCQWVAVHDGARPLVTPDLIRDSLQAAADTGAAVPGIPVADTVKESDTSGRVIRTLDRGRLWAVQTPQTFRYDVLLRAHREVSDDVTDDAAMLEVLRLPVKLFPGSPSNIKITTPHDLRLAEALLATVEAPSTS
jgi:2-C-methyl-D-erythritol 4-phosphate cytidylyltransferase